METERRPLSSSLSTKRVKFVVSYDGTDFCGWAAQAGRRTVQGTLTETVRQVSGEELEITGASRTDSGAHALGQVCHMDTTRPIPPHRWVVAVNKFLPEDLRLVSAAYVQDDFHSRFSAKDRFYRYRIVTGPPNPFRNRFAHEYWKALDVCAMQEAARHLEGEHDFRAYTEELDLTVENTIRRLRSVKVRQVGSEVWIDIVGVAFLRGMMRRMSGILFEIGKGIRTPDEAAFYLTPEGMERHRPIVLPAKGLMLMKVRYGRHPVDHRTN